MACILRFDSESKAPFKPMWGVAIRIDQITRIESEWAASLSVSRLWWKGKGGAWCDICKEISRSSFKRRPMRPFREKKEKADAADKRTATLSSQLAGQNGKRTPFQTHFISAFQNTWHWYQIVVLVEADQLAVGPLGMRVKGKMFRFKTNVSTEK